MVFWALAILALFFPAVGQLVNITFVQLGSGRASVQNGPSHGGEDGASMETSGVRRVRWCEESQARHQNQPFCPFQDATKSDWHLHIGSYIRYLWDDNLQNYWSP